MGKCWPIVGSLWESVMIAYITPRDGVTRRFALIAFDRADALIEAGLLAAAKFKSGFTYLVLGS